MWNRKRGVTVYYHVIRSIIEPKTKSEPAPTVRAATSSLRSPRPQHVRVRPHTTTTTHAVFKLCWES